MFRTAPLLASSLLAALTITIATPLAAWAAGPFDGTYNGTYRTIRNDNSGNCDKLDNDNVTITIVDSAFTRTWADNKVDITVAANGSVSGSAVRGQNIRTQRVISFTAKIAGGVMEGEYGHDKCAVKLSLRKN